MRGAPSVVKISNPVLSKLLTEHKEGEDDKKTMENEVVNFFEKKTYNMKKRDPKAIDPRFRRNPDKLFAFEGRYEDMEMQHFDDDNINAAIEFRTGKQRHTDFFFKLHDLNEKIEVFNTIFASRQPKFISAEYQEKVTVTLTVLSIETNRSN